MNHLVDNNGLRSGCQQRESRHTTGFTLLEVLIAASILSIVAVILHGSFSTVLNSVERVRNEQELLRIADSLVSHFEKNISGAYLPPRSVARQDASFVGYNQDVGGRAVDGLTFVTTAPRMAGGALPGDTKQVTYALEEVDTDIYLFTVYEQPRLLLARSGLDQGAASPAASWSVPMASLDFKYSDGAQLYDLWNSAEMGRLPNAVYIEARFVTEEVAELMKAKGMGKPPVLAMVVSIPLGLSAHGEDE